MGFDLEVEVRKKILNFYRWWQWHLAVESTTARFGLE